MVYNSEKWSMWRNQLIAFAKSINKYDSENYVNSMYWTARQGGKNLTAEEDIKIKYLGCTTEENAAVYSLNKPVTDEFYNIFTPLGIVTNSL